MSSRIGLLYVLHFFLRIHFYSILWLFIFSWHLVTRATLSFLVIPDLSIQFQTILSLSYSSNMYSTYKLASNRGNRRYIQTKVSQHGRCAHTASVYTGRARFSYSVSYARQILLHIEFPVFFLRCWIFE